MRAEAGGGRILSGPTAPPTDELRVGLDLVYFGFDKNLSGFTFGQGGYFSPQSYFAAPGAGELDVPKRSTNLTYFGWRRARLAGFPWTSHRHTTPATPGLQAQLQTIAAGVPGLQTSYRQPERQRRGPAPSTPAAEYSVTPKLKVGASGSYQHAGDYDEGQGLLYARYTFGGAN